MAFRILFLLLLIQQSVANAQASWKKVSVTGSYPGRGETAFSRCGGTKLCLLGGRGSNRVHVLDTDKLQWSRGQPNAVEMHHFQGFQGPDECVWVAGAWTGPYPHEETIDNIWRYCPDSNEWYEDAPISRPRGSGGAFLHNGKIYLVSGNVGGHRKGAMVVPWFDSYDPETGKWEQLPDIPHARDHCHAVVRNNKVYVAGGRRSTSNAPEFFDDTVAEVDVYDFASGKWSTLATLDRPRGGTASAVYDNTVYLLGGEGDNRAWTEVDVLGNEGFERGPSLPEPRHGTGVVSCNGAIWIAGGARVLGGGNNAKDTYAFFEGNDPPTCRYHKGHKTEGDVNRGTELDDPLAESTPDEVSETPIPFSSLETTDSVPISPNPTVVSNPAESPTTEFSAAPTPVSSLETTESQPIFPSPTVVSNLVEPGVPEVDSSTEIVDVEQQEPISVEVHPESSPSLNPDESAFKNPEGLPSDGNSSEQIPGNESPRKRFSRDRNTSRKVPYGEFAIVESTAPVEEALTIESPGASPLAVENEFGAGSGLSEPGPLSQSANSVPMEPLSTSSASALDSEVISVPLLVDSDKDDLQNESSPEPVDSEDEMNANLINESSPEPTSLVEIVSKGEESKSVLTQEPEGTNLLLEEELFDDVEASTEADERTSSCFPSDALVELEDGSTKPMAFLRIGDRVKVAHPDVYSEVFFFSHKHAEKISKFLELKTSAEGVSLTLSHDHLVYANGMAVEASTVRAGDKLVLGNEAKPAFVTDVIEVEGSGLHHPHTMHGDIVVNGVVASTFTSAVHPRLAKVLLLPFKTAFYMIQNKVYLEGVNKLVLRALDATWWGASAI